MRYKLAIVVIVLISISKVNVAQNVGIGTDFPNDASILEIRSNQKGILIPRLSITERDTSLSGLTVTERGLLIYNISDGEFNYWNGSIWIGFPG